MNAYDRVPYPDLAYPQTHPSRMAVLGWLFGLRPAPIATCRVLEIGCAGGGNLLPMAATLPEASFTGIDAAARQIEDGMRRCARLGLNNLRLVQCDLRQPPDDLGMYDYIVAHGVYSWVPAEVRDALLALCRARLEPHGIAYISYNCYPGWHGASVVRDLMRYHTRSMAEPRARAQAARAIVATMAGWIAPGAAGGYASLFHRYTQEVSTGLKGGEDGFLLHDELEEVNEPVYFHQFVAHAAQHGLRYLGEAVLRDCFPHSVAAHVADRLESATQDRVEAEQYADFARNRMFRQTLLCHAACPVAEQASAVAVPTFWARSQAVRVPPDEARLPRAFGQFRSSDGLTLTTGHGVTQAAMERLRGAWPNAVPFDDLLLEASRSAGRAPREERSRLAEDLLRAHGYSPRLVEFHVQPAPCAGSGGALPLAFAPARLEAETRNLVTNLWHERVWLTETQCRLLVLLDGTRTRPALLAQLEAAGVVFTLHALEQEMGVLAQAGLLSC